VTVLPAFAAENRRGHREPACPNHFAHVSIGETLEGRLVTVRERDCGSRVMFNRVANAVRAASHVALAITIAIAASSRPALGQVGLGTGFAAIGQVGGVLIDANGVLVNAERDDLHKLRALRARALAEVPGDLREPAELRKVSLRGLAAVIDDCRQNNRPLPDEVKCLAGLQRVRFVFLYPERNDIVLAGFGEGWEVGDSGEIVGVNTGRAVLLLDDLLVALRSAMQAAQGGISCSIDPTPEGLRRYQQAMKFQTTIGPDPEATIRGIEQQLGSQTITVTGVPDTSHFARVLVAADYRMKRLAMNFDPPPITGLPSYLHMMRSGGRGKFSAMPRWWLATNYQPLLTDDEGLAWELRGPGVKAMTEEDFLTASGDRVHSGKASPLAQKWADNMTARYDELSKRDPIFGELRNCMDLAIVAALTFKERLADKAHCDLSTLVGQDGLQVQASPAPKHVDSKASVLQRGDDWIISASGGVLIHSWGVADSKEQSDSLDPLRTKAAAPEASKDPATQPASWWWN
jgi:hypothetical protein